MCHCPARKDDGKVAEHAGLVWKVGPLVPAGPTPQRGCQCRPCLPPVPSPPSLRTQRAWEPRHGPWPRLRLPVPVLSCLLRSRHSLVTDTRKVLPSPSDRELALPARTLAVGPPHAPGPSVLSGTCGHCPGSPCPARPAACGCVWRFGPPPRLWQHPRVRGAPSPARLHPLCCEAPSTSGSHSPLVPRALCPHGAHGALVTSPLRTWSRWGATLRPRCPHTASPPCPRPLPLNTTPLQSVARPPRPLPQAHSPGPGHTQVRLVLCLRPSCPWPWISAGSRRGPCAPSARPHLQEPGRGLDRVMGPQASRRVWPSSRRPGGWGPSVCGQRHTAHTSR